MQQYFINEIAKMNDTIKFDGEQAHHILNVLRMKNNDIVRIVDANHHMFYGSLQIEQKDVYACIHEEIEDTTKTNVEIVLLQGLIKGEKWDYVIQKACELGVSKIVPFVSSRSVVKIQDEKMDKKLVRWNKIALEACEQCKRSTLVEVTQPIAFKDILTYQSDLNLIAYEEADAKSEKLYDALAQNKTISSISCVIGSEGGFSKEEVDYLNKQGFMRISLGTRILRAETAAISIVNSIGFYYEMIGDRYDTNRENSTKEV